MFTLGLDIGTTTISAVVTDVQQKVIETVTRPHNAFLSTPHTWERIQDANLLLCCVLEITEQLIRQYTICRIGITGQQHGIVYLDKGGKLLSPLYTWQDQRGSLPWGDSNYTQYLSQKSGYSLAPGYGLVTHFYNLQNGLAPPDAACICTIHDYIAMVLAGRTQPLVDPSDAHSLGFYNLDTGCFDKAALKACGIDPAILPEVQEHCIIGKTKNKIPVAIAIGDNPASFMGATHGQQECILLNIGTGSQISLWTEHPLHTEAMEPRPYPLGGYLLVGAALCGGKAWALTERFFSDAVFLLTGQRINAYDGLEKIVSATIDGDNIPCISTTFDGTRQDPTKRASITNLGADNFTPGQIALGVLHGMINELYVQYRSCPKEKIDPHASLIGSGNALRRSANLQRIASDTFGIPLTLSESNEEAAIGAAYFASSIPRSEIAF